MRGAEGVDSPLAIEENVPLAPFTSFGIGGPARYFVRVSTVHELRQALLFAREQRLPWYVVGGGTNILVSDAGFAGIVVRLEASEVHREETGIVAGAGASLAAVVDRAAAGGLSGMEFFAGIPGSVGGAVRGNAGAFGASIGGQVTAVSAFDVEAMLPVSFSPVECAFSYRTSLFKKTPNLIVLSVRLELAPGKPGEIRRQMEQVFSRRMVLLENEKSVGSYFVNPVPTDAELIRKFEDDRKVVCRNCMIPAGWFIDKAGLRGLKVGGAMVSERHGNYLINIGNATAADMRRLAALIKERVREKLGVDLEEEVGYVGFEESP